MGAEEAGGMALTGNNPYTSAQFESAMVEVLPIENLSALPMGVAPKRSDRLTCPAAVEAIMRHARAGHDLIALDVNSDLTTLTLRWVAQ
jgi:hypothetical protein